MTVNAKPNDSAEYNKFEVFGYAPGSGIGVLETWVPANEKKRNRNVPTNSPNMQSKLKRMVSGIFSIGNWPRLPEPVGPARVEVCECSRLGNNMLSVVM